MHIFHRSIFDLLDPRQITPYIPAIPRNAQPHKIILNRIASLQGQYIPRRNQDTLTQSHCISPDALHRYRDNTTQEDIIIPSPSIPVFILEYLFDITRSVQCRRDPKRGRLIHSNIAESIRIKLDYIIIRILRLEIPRYA